MRKIRLNILGLSVSQTQSGAYALVLAEENGDRRIPIIIGPIEAQAIAIQLEALKPPRPLTHDLLKNMAVAFDINILEVVIYKLEEGIFYSELSCETGTKNVLIDSRTSDAVALALRFKCPIYTTEEILKKAGIVFDESEEDPVVGSSEKSSQSESSEFDNFNAEELTKMMNESISRENYERASKIRDEINRRKS